MNTGRKQRPLGRDECTFRDDRLFVIATEDRYAPKQYFDALARMVRSSRIKIKVLPTEDCRSSPQHVFDRLEEFEQQHESHAEDEKWLMLDTDHWIQAAHRHRLKEVLKCARQKGYKVAMSRPCFEIWLLNHHHENVAGLGILKCDDVRPHLLVALGEYNKTRLNPIHFPLSSIHLAVSRSKVQDSQPALDEPSGNCSRVYLIVEQILDSVPAHLR
jgi:hypothetical protein